MDNLTNHARPSTDAIITVRCIKSFEYRTCKNAVLKHIDLENTTVGELKAHILETIRTTSGWKPYLSVEFDTLKLYTVAHGHKTQNLIINMEDDKSLILSDDSATLAWLGIENEAELSFFNREAYEAFKKNPDMKW
ncbi:hypothetical protein J3Q64DRAFT_1390543 [Phycomyces blakesleeanus]|uniref:Cytoplasmic protein n=2 Tax=Phycomyces blakesleeanus TaxID=4837 RepID=A0A163A0U7_PHYB8|nr:hypothetical protein PHYBLDRAFT_115499 [Phycomyces blakesleeanus NRRL 1555(-)]OAD70301.1 hypothetical protein PHYBLDRAFT_115499 [Phycomyces blakesleeanus NRRL 1555(-)]|eukprot:XP_018288341.1 hypothetical protein PHYBLDRAFT_115499 [Phycomyces blakesleeanus NRRL 1555(-)]